ncbi:hypothetical protein Bbelb_041320 [Branchiostoma belcheri]|nr:hypothetical protein Bbelb_041320 [Branchiostoma belcheri]
MTGQNGTIFPAAHGCPQAPLHQLQHTGTQDAPITADLAPDLLPTYSRPTPNHMIGGILTVFGRPQEPFARWSKLPLRENILVVRGEFGWPYKRVWERHRAEYSPRAQLHRSGNYLRQEGYVFRGVRGKNYPDFVSVRRWGKIQVVTIPRLRTPEKANMAASQFDILPRMPCSRHLTTQNVPV